jgi:hypothetical protein
MRAVGFAIAYPGPVVTIVGVLILSALMRMPAVLGLAFLPILRLWWRLEQQHALNRSLGITNETLVTDGIPKVALVEAGEGAIAIEGLNRKISRDAFIGGRIHRPANDEQSFVLVLQAKRAIPNFLIGVTDESEGNQLMRALFHEAPRTLAAETRAPTTDDTRTKLLERGDRNIDDWVDALRGRATTNYRTPSLGSSELWPLLEDEDAPHEVRAAAAVALGPTLDKSGRERFVRIKKDAPYRLRVVLKVARADDTAAIAKALAACCD